MSNEQENQSTEQVQVQDQAQDVVVDTQVPEKQVENQNIEVQSSDLASNKRKIDEDNDKDKTSENNSEESQINDELIDDDVSVKKQKVEGKKTLQYIPSEFLDTPTLEKTLTYSKPMVINTGPGKGGKLIKTEFSYKKFKSLHPEAPNLSHPGNPDEMISCTTWMKTPFGYSPTTKGVKGAQNDTNNLRLVFQDPIDHEEMENDRDTFKRMDEYILKVILENKKEFGLENKSDEIIRNDYKSIYRKSLDEDGNQTSFPDYVNLKFQTQKEDKKRKIEANHYKAFASVWSYDKKKLTDVLELKDSNGYEGEDKTELIPKNSYVKVGWVLKRIFIGKTGIVPQLYVQYLQLGDLQELKGLQSDSKNKEVCPF